MTARASYAVIIATYNYGRFLAQALNSALQQTLPARQIVVVDDGSVDDTQDVLAAFAGRVEIVRKENGGQASAWNRALPLIDSEWVAFLDADDWWAPDRMERVLSRTGPDRGVIMHDLRVITPDETIDSWVKWTAVRVREGDIGSHTVRHGLPWSFTPTSAITARRDVLDSIFPLDSLRWRTCADASLLHRAALRTRFRYIPEALATYRVHGGNAYHQHGWYDGNDHPRIILDNLWLIQKLAYEVNADLRAFGRKERVSLWNNTYYSKMVGWVSGRHSWWDVMRMILLQHRDRGDLHRLRAVASGVREIHGYQHRRDRELGDQLRQLLRTHYPGFDLNNVWEPEIEASLHRGV